MELGPIYLGCSTSQSESSYNRNSSPTLSDFSDDLDDDLRVAAAIANQPNSTPSPSDSHKTNNSGMSLVVSGGESTNASAIKSTRQQGSDTLENSYLDVIACDQDTGVVSLPSREINEQIGNTTSQPQQQQEERASDNPKTTSECGKSKKLFPQKLWELINNPNYDFCLRWSSDGQLVYLNRDVFEESYLRQKDNQFHTQKAISFVRQMNMYGFRKVDDSYYENPNFKRDKPEKIKDMVRKNTKDEPCEFRNQSLSNGGGGSSGVSPSLLFRASTSTNHHQNQQRSHHHNQSQNHRNLSATSLLLDPRQQQQQQQNHHHNLNHQSGESDNLSDQQQIPSQPHHPMTDTLPLLSQGSQLGNMVTMLIQQYQTNPQQLLSQYPNSNLSQQPDPELIYNYLSNQIINNISATGQLPAFLTTSAAASPSTLTSLLTSSQALDPVALDLHFQNHHPQQHNPPDRHEESLSSSLDGYSASGNGALGNNINDTLRLESHLLNWNNQLNGQLNHIHHHHQQQQQQQQHNQLPAGNKRKPNRSARSYKRSVDSILDIDDNYNKFPANKSKAQQAPVQLNANNTIYPETQQTHIESTPSAPITPSSPITTTTTTTSKQAESLIVSTAASSAMDLDEEAIRKAARMTEKFAKILMEAAQLIAKYSSSCSNNNGDYIPSFASPNGSSNKQTNSPIINSGHLKAALTLLPKELSNLID